ncbi:hypothetical protein [Rhodohalobacter mucosus]|uniref:Uncharacterized protein n=1 Tax=Rhodohalobacter mucosus TaxID=2079485 RepID=A0A316TTA5_9BACT|nr:hypothetical protein [Rhodohalobacter mucosus]PWN07827.1 hypothetical protein DDZ15_02110 [Rhodohalobacter mucosus]
MMRRYRIAILFMMFIGLTTQLSAQLPENISDRYIRVAEFGQLVDSINVWGDVNSGGRYLVPEGTNLPELISYSFGFSELRDREASIDWAKLQIEVKVSRFNNERKMVEVAFFRYRYHDPEPPELWEFDLQNNDVVTLQVRRRPAIGDYVGVIAPILTVVTTTFLLIERLTE